MKAFLVYCKENQNIADNLSANLSKVGIQLILDTRDLDKRMDEYKLLSSHPNATIILLISDNFLKDKACMYEALNFLQNPSLKNRVYTIITDGKKVNALGGVDYEPTQFERVSNVIHYMNYWQDQYLELRKKKRDSNFQETEFFNQELQYIRNISSEIGEFLRILRSTNYADYTLLHKNKFEGLFRKASWNNLYAAFRDHDMTELDNNSKSETDINIADIPGMNLLNKTTGIIENKIETIQETSNKIIETPITNNPIVSENNNEGKIESVKEILQNNFGGIKETAEEKISDLEEVKENIFEEKSVIDDLPVPPTIQEIIPDAELDAESNIVSKLTDYQSEKEKIKEEIQAPVEEKLDELSEEEKKIEEEKTAFEKEGLSYQDKSSYELLVSLFEDDGSEDYFDTNGKENLLNDEVKIQSEIIEENIILEKDIVSNKEIIEEKVEEIIADEESENELEEEVHISFEEIQEIKEEIAADNTPHDVEAAIALIQENEPLEAMKTLKGILDVEPNNIKAKYHYGLLLSDYIKNYKDAKKQFASILKLDPNNIEVHLRLAELNELSDDYSRAKKHYERAIDIDSSYPGLQYKFANLLLDHFKNHKKKAAKHFKVAYEQDPNNLDALYQRAVIQNKELDKPHKALKKLQQVVHFDPQHPYANLDIAFIYHELGKKELAWRYYQDAFKNNPELKTEKNDFIFHVDLIQENIEENETIEKERKVEEMIVNEEIIDEMNETFVPTIQEENTFPLENDSLISTDSIHENKEEIITDVFDKEEANKISNLIQEINEDKEEKIEIETSSIEEILEEENIEDIIEGEIEENIVEEEVSILEKAEEEIETSSLEEFFDSEEEIIEEKESSSVLEKAGLGLAGAVITNEIFNKKEEEDIDDESQSILEDLDNEIEEISIEPEIVEEIEPIVLEKIQEEKEIEEILFGDEPETVPSPKTITKDIILITGATSGIGKATAELFAAQGHDIIITGRRKERLEELKSNLENEHGNQVDILEFDIRNLDACKRAVEKMGHVDVLINNAGLAKGRSPIYEGNIDHWNTMIDTNIKGLLYMTRLVVPQMVERRKGHIINISSVAGKTTIPQDAIYCATKSAVDALSDTMRKELTPHGVRVSTISPGAVGGTEFPFVRWEENVDAAEKNNADRPMNTKDVAEIIHFIASRPSHINIKDITVMGILLDE